MGSASLQNIRNAIIILVVAWIGSFFVFGWIASIVDPSEQGENAIEIAGQIGDRFGAINALFSGIALILIGLSLRQTNLSIAQQNKMIEMQHKELKDQNESWLLISYLSILEQLVETNDESNLWLAEIQRDSVKTHLSMSVKKIIGDLPTLTNVEKRLVSIKCLLGNLDEVLVNLPETTAHARVGTGYLSDFEMLKYKIEAKTNNVLEDKWETEISSVLEMIEFIIKQETNPISNKRYSDFRLAILKIRNEIELQLHSNQLDVKSSRLEQIKEQIIQSL